MPLPPVTVQLSGQPLSVSLPDSISLCRWVSKSNRLSNTARSLIIFYGRGNREIAYGLNGEILACLPCPNGLNSPDQGICLNNQPGTEFNEQVKLPLDHMFGM
jgi:hypothetical protein